MFGAHWTSDSCATFAGTDAEAGAGYRMLKTSAGGRCWRPLLKNNVWLVDGFQMGVVLYIFAREGSYSSDFDKGEGEGRK